MRPPALVVLGRRRSLVVLVASTWAVATMASNEGGGDSSRCAQGRSMMQRSTGSLGAFTSHWGEQPPAATAIELQPAATPAQLDEMQPAVAQQAAALPMAATVVGQSDDASPPAMQMIAGQPSGGQSGTAQASTPGAQVKPTHLQRAIDVLPQDLYELGAQIFGSPEALNVIVAQSTLELMHYANETMSIRVAGGDDARHRLPGENGEGYGLDGLDSLLKARARSTGMVNVIDMGGNYGTVTIAAFKKYPAFVRAVVAEPVPATYFFLRWNMWLNKVPVVDEDTFIRRGHEPGVAVLHAGITDTPDQLLRICTPPGSTMNAYLSFDNYACRCLDTATPCHEVKSIQAEHMFNLFGQEDITLLKVDCEGCERDTLPQIVNGPASDRVLRMTGELHNPDPSLVQLACNYEKSEKLTYMTAWCRGGVGRINGADICNHCTVW